MSSTYIFLVLVVIYLFFDFLVSYQIANKKSNKFIDYSINVLKIILQVIIVAFFLSTPFIYLHLRSKKEFFYIFFEIFDLLGFALIIYFIFFALKKKGYLEIFKKGN
jgi:hypothetical protein